MKVLISTASGSADTYPFNETTKITFNDGNINFNTASGSKMYSPRDIKKMTFGSSVTGITISQTTASIEVGETVTLTATVLPANAMSKDVVWSSNKEDVAKVSADGVVTGIKEGTAVITASAVDGSNVKASCTVTVTPITVKSITLNYETYRLDNGGSITLVATLLPDNAKNKAVKWSSSDDKIATVSSTGVVTGIKEGAVTITAESTDGSNIKASCTIQVGPVKVNSITLNHKEYTIEQGETVTLNATVLPTDAKNKEVKWTSSNEKVATVSSKGVVFGVSKGTAVITAESTDGSEVKATATITVLHTVPVSTITFANDIQMIKPNETLTLTPTISPADASNMELKWTSSDESIATVTDGVVKGIAGGMVTITASATDGSDVKATCKVIVDGPFADYNNYLNSSYTGQYSMSQIGSYITKAIGFYIENVGTESVKIDKVTIYKTNGTLVGSTSDQSLLGTLSAGNKISLSFTVHEDISLSSYYYVWNYTYKGKSCVKKSNESSATIPVCSVTLDTHSATLKATEKVTLKADILPTIASNKETEWTSSDTKIATVDNNGVVTAVAVGKATIKATSKYDSKIFDECEVTVEATPVASIQLSKNDVKLEEGESVTLTATVSPATATVKDVTWTSSNEDVAMVSKSGKVLAVKAGTATITAMATDGSGVKATATVTVTPVTVKSIVLNHTSYSLEKGESVTLEVTLAPENAANKKVTWSSSNEDVVMVSSTGRCICLGEGTATVTATTTDGSNLSATCVFNCTDGIITITMDGDSDIKVYDIEGRKLGNLKKGVNIIRMDDGTTRKVVKK